MFKTVLSGLGRFAMLVNVSPTAEEFNETKRVLEVRQRDLTAPCSRWACPRG
jgi:hypothetical protein